MTPCIGNNISAIFGMVVEEWNFGGIHPKFSDVNSILVFNLNSEFTVLMLLCFIKSCQLLICINIAQHFIQSFCVSFDVPHRLALLKMIS